MKSYRQILTLIAQGWEVIESDGSQMTIQAPKDWEGDGETELLVSLDEATDAALAIGEHAFRAGFVAGVRNCGNPVVNVSAEDRAWSDYEPPEEIKALS